MWGLCNRLAEWITSPFSAVVYFQKHFVDDVADTVKRQKEQFDRHAREAQERAVQLHLDELEAQYLCCVCGRPGEVREEDAQVYDTFSLVTLPPRRTIVRGIQLTRELEDLEEAEAHGENAGARGARPTTRRRCSARVEEERRRDRRRRRQRRARRAAQASPLSREMTSYYDSEGSEGSDSLTETCHTRRNSSDEDSDGEGRRPGRVGQESSRVDFYSAAPTGGRAGDGVRGAERGGGGGGGPIPVVEEVEDYPAMDPELVPPLEIRNMMYKIRHAVLNKEARIKRRAVHVHKDKGLTKIEESEIDMYSSFFQRPVHGYLCHECYTSARQRLDTVTEQIQTILFKARHPFLRKVSAKEVSMLSAAGQLSSGVLSSIVELQRRWQQQQEATTMRAVRLRHRREQAQREGLPDGAAASAFEDEEASRASVAVDEAARQLLPSGTAHISAGGSDPFKEATATMSDETILGLRSVVRCAVCQRRPCCYFNRISVIFLCQFCTARDRFYREHSVCINDELLPAETVHLLTELARYHEGAHRARELRQLPQTELAVAQTDLFGVEESLFRIQSIPRSMLPMGVAALAEADRHEVAAPREWPQEEQSSSEVAAQSPSGYVHLKVEPRPYVDVEEMRRREAGARESVGRTQLSLFENTRLEPVVALDLFTNNKAGQPGSAEAEPSASATTASRGDLMEGLPAINAAPQVGGGRAIMGDLFSTPPPPPGQP